jgi:hypothetical protein
LQQQQDTTQQKQIFMRVSTLDNLMMDSNGAALMEEDQTALV